MSSAGIVVRDNVAYISLTDPELWAPIVDATSFVLEGSDFRMGGRKDKRTKLVRNAKAPVGLLDRICRVLAQQGVVPDLTYADTQQAPKPRIALQLFGVEPRDYQEEAALAAQLEDRGVFRVPTGGGKSLIALMAIAARGYHSLIIVPTIDLLHQFRDYATEHLIRQPEIGWIRAEEHLIDPQEYPWKIGQLGDGVVDPQPVTVATIRTIAKVLNVAYESYEFAEYDDTDDTEVNARELRAWVESLGTVIVDEAHQLGAKTLYEVVTKIPALVKLGMSASPWRDDGADLMIEAATGPCVCHVPVGRLVQGGYLMAPEFHTIDTSTWWKSAAWGSVCVKCNRQRLGWTKAPCPCGHNRFRSQWNDAYREEIVKNPVRNAKIAKKVQDLNRPTLVLVKQVSHGRGLQQLIPNSIFLSGSNKGEDRQAVFDAMRVGLQKTIICTTIADQGLDLPSLEALVLAGGGKSSTRHLQRVGRVVRTAPSKATPIVIDFKDSHIHAWFERHYQKRRQIEKEEWGGFATWVHE